MSQDQREEEKQEDGGIQTLMVSPSDLKTQEPFSTLFPIKEETLAAIVQDMETNGFDPVFPLVVWEEKAIVVDGHTRFTAARSLRTEQVPAIFKSFESEDDALLYSFHIQRNRRNISDDDILKCLSLLDTIHESEAPDPDAPKTTRKAVNEARAKELGISPQKVDKARKVLEHGNDEIQEHVKEGKKSINQAFNEIQQIRRESGEIKGQEITGLGKAEAYTKTLGKFLKEVSRIKEGGWQAITREKALADLESIKELINS